MVTYGDYFSRKVLHYCGVSPNETMFHKEESVHTDMNRTENIRLKMSEIYQTLYQGFARNNADLKGGFDELQVERKIVASFYDSGILNNAERDYFQTQSLRDMTEREQISVEEASLSAEPTKIQKVAVQAKVPLERKMRQ